MALSLDQALTLYPTLGSGARASISRGTFTGSAALEAMVHESVAIAGAHITPEGAIVAGADGSPEDNVARFRAAVAAGGTPVEAAFEKDASKLLTREQRLEATIRAVYRLGKAIDEAGNLA